MKKVTFLGVVLLMTLSFNTYGQTALNYSEVIKVDSISKDELYNRAKIWFAIACNSSKDILQMDNKEEGQIIGKAKMSYNPTILNASGRTYGIINYTIKLYLKDGRYKYEITDFIHVPTGNSSYGNLPFDLITTDVNSPIQHKGQYKSWNDKVWNDIKNQISDKITPLIESLKKSMLKKAETKNENW